MLKISITGKANSGKNTLGKIICKELRKNNDALSCEYIAFADPIKKIARLMFPDLPKKFLTGASKYRSEIIPLAFTNDCQRHGKPLTVRQLLIDLGNTGRTYNEKIWLDCFDSTFSKAEIKCKDIVIVTDCRFRHEFDHLKKMGFIQIRLVRESINSINDSTETNQDFIKNEEFDHIIVNNLSLNDLKKSVNDILIQLK